jgi:hypothetical protein
MPAFECDLILRWKIQTYNRTYCELLPEGYKNWQVWVSASKGFAQGYATLASDETAFQVVVTEEGTYNVLAIGEKK